MLLGQFETVADWKLLLDYVKNVRSVTTDDVMRVAKQYFAEDNRTVGILLPEKDKGAASPAAADELKPAGTSEKN
jgi:predicted Zn-dependent peptidase